CHRDRQPSVSNLAGPDQRRDRTHRLLDRDGGVHPVLVVKIDVIHAQSLERPITSLTDVLGSTVDAGKAAIGTPDISELRSEDDLIAPTANGLAHQLFVGV